VNRIPDKIRVGVLAATLGITALPASGQTSPSGLPLQVGHDEAQFLSSAARVTKRDWRWILPVAGTTAVLIATDQRNMQERRHINPDARGRSLMLSNAGLVTLVTIPGLIGWHGWRHRDVYDEQTGWLAARAVADAGLTAALLRMITQRERPVQSSAVNFFSGRGLDSAFPSLHAASAWALASVIAQRHPGWLTKAAVYGLASGATFGRVIGRDHSPSDAFAGSTLGILIGRYVAAKGSGRPEWDPFRASSEKTVEKPGPESAPHGSAYVPLDSWVYPGLDRLAALGLIPSQTSGLRPWTAAECERQVAEAEGLIARRQKDAADMREAEKLVQELRGFLGRLDGGVTLDSLYTQNGVIAGPVLNDSFHFGQTWSNDFGRPFGRGWNSDTGFTARAESGRFFAFVTGEYQRDPRSTGYPEPVRQAISAMDGVPVRPAGSTAGCSRFRTLDTYAGFRLGDFEFSAGKQSLWWGPTGDSPLLFGANPEPTKNLRVSTVHPIRLPELWGHVIGVRGEFVIGKLGGQQYTWRPWFNAQKLTVKLTDNLELGFTRSAIFWGVGHPITVGSFIRDMVSTNSPGGPAGVGRNDPGDRKGGFDFRYRVPGLRNWLTLYSDSYADDDPSPLAAPRRAAINPGLYLSRVPGAPKLDFRLEAPSTMPMEGDLGGMFIYYNNQYRSGNTNYGYLLGNSVGRDGRALEGWTSYWFTPRRRLRAGYRQVKIGTHFLPGGGTQTDVSLTGAFQLASEWRTDITLQYERFRIPLLGGAQRNLSTRLQLTWEPNLQIIKRDNWK
jgi:membrane-associated phospholipid phosphatase